MRGVWKVRGKMEERRDKECGEQGEEDDSRFKELEEPYQPE